MVRARPSAAQSLRFSKQALALCLLWMLSVSPALATNYGLLVGVSNYNHEKITKLKGPANDVTLLWRALEKRGFASENMTVLADGLPIGPGFPASQADPTRAAIMQGFERLAQRAGAGDLVLIYFSGHGTEQLAADTSQNPERGNRDQVMLPIDAGTYDQASKTVRNGIVDNEIGIALDRIRDRGTDVWVIIDACHAGSMTRGLVDGVVVRGVEPSALGIPFTTDAIASGAPAVSSKVTQGKSSQFGSRSGAGSLVEFFAVDSQFEAVERPFDAFAPPMIGADVDRRVGVFTYFLYSALADGRRPIATYRDLAHQIVRNMQRSEAPPPPPALPLFGGDLNRPLLAIGTAPPPAAWAAKLDGDTVEVEAGALHGVTENAVLKLSLAPADDAPEWGQAVVRKADPIRSIASLDRFVRSIPPEQLWARLATPGVSFALAVAEPPAEELDVAARTLLDEIKLQMKQRRQGAIDWVSSNATAADVRLRTHAGRVWILPPDGEWVREDFQETKPRLRAYPLTPSYPILSPSSAMTIAGALHAIARARNMVRLAETADASQSWHELKVAAERLPAFGDNQDSHRPCPDLAQVSEERLKSATPIELGAAQTVFHCDLVRITLQNNGPRDVDVNVSYIDAGSGIKNLLGRDCTVTLPARSSPLVRSLWITTWDRRANAPDSIGREHIVVTAVERREQSQADLCFIQEAVRGVDRGQRRGTVAGKAGWLFAALEQAALASSGTRGVQQADADDTPESLRAGMFLVTLQVTPTVTP
jgi:hypothetical protein